MVVVAHQVVEGAGRVEQVKRKSCDQVRHEPTFGLLGFPADVQLKFYFTFDIVKSNIFARLHNFPPLVDKSHPDSEVEDDIRYKMISKKK